MKYKILLVGGEACDGQLSEVLLTSRDIACAWCRNTGQAADVFERDHAVIDMVLVSVRATGEMSSDELVRWMRESEYKHPIIALTDDVAPDNLRIAPHIKAGCNMHHDRSGLTVQRVEALLADAVLKTPKEIPPFRVERVRTPWRKRLSLWLLDVFIWRWAGNMKLVSQTSTKKSAMQKPAPETTPKPQSEPVSEPATVQ